MVGAMVLPRERVLVVEDEKEIRELLVIQLQRDGFVVDAFGDGEQAVRQLEQEAYQLVLLDWMLPGASGLEIAKHIRSQSKHSRVPILMVTARVEPGDIISGLEAGADDYITKPFDSSILMARVRALVRRARVQNEERKTKPTTLDVAGIKLNIPEHRVTCGGDEVHLTPSEFKLLETFMQNVGKVFTRESLIFEVQGSGVSVVDRAIDTHIFGLRKKLGEYADFVETVRGVGYRVKAPEQNQ